MIVNPLAATILSCGSTTKTTTSGLTTITTTMTPATVIGQQKLLQSRLLSPSDMDENNKENGIDHVIATITTNDSITTLMKDAVTPPAEELENCNLRDLGLSEVLGTLRLEDNNKNNSDNNSYHNQRFSAPDAEYSSGDLQLFERYCSGAAVSGFHTRYDPSGLSIGDHLHQQPGAWYHEGSAVIGGPGGDRESSGFYSAGGSAAGGFSADCSPPLSGGVPVGASGPGTIGSSGPQDYDTNFDDDFDQQLLKATDPSLPGGRNVTESVEVPSSEHVAEIVGRQGCKIKALRAKTNTYIKTPVRGEDPVFVVTGRLEDVLDAKREIECAAEHFTQIRASRRHSQGGVPAPGHVTAYVRVPLRVVGLVVGPKGATIKRIQQDTHTYIITPSREREPVFEVTGLVQNVEMARREIEQHIYQRTGNMPITNESATVPQYEMNTISGQPVVNRPNYGALAAVTTISANSQTVVVDSYADYQRKQQQQQQWQALDCRAAASYGGSAAYANAATFSLDGFHNSAQQPAAPRKALFTQSCPVSAAVQHPQIQAQASASDNGGFLFGNGGQPQRHVDDAGWSFKDRSYHLWSDADPVFGLSEDFLSNNNNNNSTAPEPFNSLIIGGTCGLTSVNSTSRDEGLGDSPINSLGKQHVDLFGQHSSYMSIWSTPIDVVRNAVGIGQREKIAGVSAASNPPTQFATA